MSDYDMEAQRRSLDSHSRPSSRGGGFGSRGRPVHAPHRPRPPPTAHAQSESAGPNFSWGLAVATLGRPGSEAHCQEFFGSGTVRKILTVGPPQCSYGLAPRFFWTCGFTLSVDSRS